MTNHTLGQQIPGERYAYKAADETHSHSTLIYELVRLTNARTYLELGVWEGETFCSIAPVVSRCIGVDRVDHRKVKVGEFYTQTTDQFFGWFRDPVDIAFIDADHQYEQVKKDFHNVLPLLAPMGIIILHDTDPMERKLLDPGYCGDSFRMIDYIYSHLPSLEVFTMPVTQAGLTFVKRKDDRRVLKLVS